jgi:hypothetical protein
MHYSEKIVLELLNKKRYMQDLSDITLFKGEDKMNKLHYCVLPVEIY